MNGQEVRCSTAWEVLRFLPWNMIFLGEVSWFSMHERFYDCLQIPSFIIYHPSSSPPSWPGWACQCPWKSPSFSESQKPCCLTFLYKFLKVNKSGARLSLSMFMAKYIIFSKPKTMLVDLLVSFSEGQKICKSTILSITSHNYPFKSWLLNPTDWDVPTKPLIIENVVVCSAPILNAHRNLRLFE